MGDLKMPMCVRVGSWRTKDHITEAVQLLRRIVDLFQSLLESVLSLLIRAQYGTDDPFEELSSRAVGVEDTDRRDGHGEAGVVFDELSQSLLRPLVLAVVPRIQIVLCLLVIRSVFQLFEDLEGRSAFLAPNPPLIETTDMEVYSREPHVHRLLPAKPLRLLVDDGVVRALRLGMRDSERRGPGDGWSRAASWKPRIGLCPRRQGLASPSF